MLQDVHIFSIQANINMWNLSFVQEFDFYKILSNQTSTSCAYNNIL